jgi:hypothetical protein
MTATPVANLERVLRKSNELKDMFPQKINLKVSSLRRSGAKQTLNLSCHDKKRTAESDE